MALDLFVKVLHQRIQGRLYQLPNRFDALHVVVAPGDVPLKLQVSVVVFFWIHGQLSCLITSHSGGWLLS